MADIILQAEETAMIHPKDEKQIMQEFALRQGRQFFAIAITLLLLLLLVLLYKRTDIFGESSKNVVIAGQVVLIAAFVGFSVFNWRCPACKEYLGPNINRRTCRNCGTRLR